MDPLNRLAVLLKPYGILSHQLKSVDFTNPAKNVSMVSYKMPFDKVRVALWTTKKDRVDLFSPGNPRIFVPSGAKLYSLCGIMPSAQGGGIELEQAPLMFELPRENFNDIKIYDD
jgi:hypothetical protein